MLTTSRIRNRLRSIQVTTPATVPLMSTAVARKYLNVTGNEDDALIDIFVKAATKAVENKARRSFLSQEVTVRHRANSLPLRLYRSPIISLDSVSTFYQGTETAEASVAEYYIGGANGLRPKVFFTDDGEFTSSDIEEIELVCTCGFGTAATDVPEEIIQAVKQVLSQLYDKRADWVEGSITPVSYDSMRLMSEHVSPVI